MSDLPPPQTPPRWRRPLFLWTSGVIAVTVMIAAREVMLPFVLAVVIAYVLTPLVASLERRKMSRGLAVVCVYTFVLGSFGTFAWAIAPRIAHEFRNLRQELPKMADQAKIGGSRDHRSADRARSCSGAGAAGGGARAGPEQLLRGEAATGWIDRDRRRDRRERRRRPRWVGRRTGAREERAAVRHEPDRQRSGRRWFAYAQQNSLEVARALRDLVTGVSRAIFVFFITLMLAAYTMLTRERLLAFFRSLVRPESARELRRAPRADRQRTLRGRPWATSHLRHQRRPVRRSGSRSSA